MESPTQAVPRLGHQGAAGVADQADGSARWRERPRRPHSPYLPRGSCQWGYGKLSGGLVRPDPLFTSQEGGGQGCAQNRDENLGTSARNWSDDLDGDPTKPMKNSTQTQKSPIQICLVGSFRGEIELVYLSWGKIWTALLSNLFSPGFLSVCPTFSSSIFPVFYPRIFGMEMFEPPFYYPCPKAGVPFPRNARS